MWSRRDNGVGDMPLERRHHATAQHSRRWHLDRFVSDAFQRNDSALPPKNNSRIASGAAKLGCRTDSGTSDIASAFTPKSQTEYSDVHFHAAKFLLIAILFSPFSALAQSSGAGSAGGGAASGPSAGTGSAAGTPSAGSAGAGSSAVSGVPSGPANVGGLNNSANDPSGAGNSAKVTAAPGTNSLGDRQLFRRTGKQHHHWQRVKPVRRRQSDAPVPAVSTRPDHQPPVTPRPATPRSIKKNKVIDKKLNSICKGC